MSRWFEFSVRVSVWLGSQSAAVKQGQRWSTAVNRFWFGFRFFVFGSGQLGSNTANPVNSVNSVNPVNSVNSASRLGQHVRCFDLTIWNIVECTLASHVLETTSYIASFAQEYSGYISKLRHG
ncbi:hypothetical protein HanOQP8_Chr12g0455001 [Helianthus annuus]|nr:hypothetical protein HanOQP8_Chr12g0455001 [Helianthus annuus]